jgi:hypothetical protein
MLKKFAVAALLVLSFAVLASTQVVLAGPEKEAADVLILKGSPFGPVKFMHKAHVDRVGGKCETCHHPSKPEKPATAPQQACRDCHTKPAVAPMKTFTQAAFHNPLAKSGTCIDCHLKENAAGKKAPTKCTECHNKSNG